MKNRCKDCKFFDNTKPASTIKGNDKPKYAEEYIGTCKQDDRIKMMNDGCFCYQPKKEKSKWK